jgi:HB1, ASXL, restriction endonuclease HTH domain
MPATKDEGTKKPSTREVAIGIIHRARGPIEVSKVVKKVLATEGVELKGKTPEATVSAMIYTEAKKEDGAIRKVGRGLVEPRR